ncbi:hypothetical protein SDC9_68937 [bioreactor metagenome]|uniref:Uncharacterized protein n=1 Tax=bioreactor metagenome TaxID=1076179 RepID=A0A644Y1T1_9ZZZZ
MVALHRLGHLVGEADTQDIWLRFGVQLHRIASQFLGNVQGGKERAVGGRVAHVGVAAVVKLLGVIGGAVPVLRFTGRALRPREGAARADRGRDQNGHCGREHRFGISHDHVEPFPDAPFSGYHGGGGV